MTTRAASKKQDAAPRPTPPVFEFFRERDRWRRQHGIVSVGRREAAARPEPPTEAELAEQDRRDVEVEIAAVIEHIARIDRALTEPARSPSIGPGRRVGAATGQAQELVAERRILVSVRSDLERDREHPVALDRDGKPLSVHWRMVRRARTRELRLLLSENAQRAEAEGDHRRARQLRVDALRARHVCEDELGWRPLARYVG